MLLWYRGISVIELFYFFITKNAYIYNIFYVFLVYLILCKSIIVCYFFIYTIGTTTNGNMPLILKRLMTTCTAITVIASITGCKFHKWGHKRLIYSRTRIFLGMGSANERRRYNITSSLIGWAHSQTAAFIFFPVLQQGHYYLYWEVVIIIINIIITSNQFPRIWCNIISRFVLLT